MACKHWARFPWVLFNSGPDSLPMPSALLMLEACKTHQYPLVEDQPVQLPDWQLFINGLADEILAEQSPHKLLQVRGKLYELVSSCIPPDKIVRSLTQALMAKMPVPIRHETIFHASLYEHRMCAGSKPIFHLEAFIARFMSVYKRNMMSGGLA